MLLDICLHLCNGSRAREIIDSNYEDTGVKQNCALCLFHKRKSSKITFNKRFHLFQDYFMQCTYRTKIKNFFPYMIPIFFFPFTYIDAYFSKFIEV